MAANRLFVLFFALTLASAALGVIRDGGVDPANLGKGEWIASMMDATNQLGGHVSSVTNENSLMLYYKSRGIRHVIVKAATNAGLYKDCYGTPQFTSNLVDFAHAHGLFIFGYNRSYGADIVAEIGISDYVFLQGADGFIWDAEAEWEDTTNATTHLPNHPWITNAPVQAWSLCSTVRSNWPTKFLAHAPFPIISWHTTFPYKEFGYWCDAVMPQIYYYGWTGVKRSPSGGINWSDANWASWQNSLVGSNSMVNGQMIYWTNAIKPLTPVNNVYGEQYTGATPCFGNNVANMSDRNVMEFVDYLSCDPNCVVAGGYQGANFFRTALHGTNQWARIGAGTIGVFAGVINNIVMDDPQASLGGSWTAVRTFSDGAFYGTTGNGSGTDTNSFGTNYFTRIQGTGTRYVQFTPTVVVPGDYDVYQWHPFRADASAGTPHIITYNGGSTTIYANQQTNDGNWSLLGRFNFAAGTAGNIRVTDGIPESGAIAIADAIKLVFVPSPPEITAQPQSQSAIAGTNVTFSVTATGSAPLSYQWRFNGENVFGATESTYVRTAVQADDAGSYSVIVTNIAGSVTSANAALIVNLPPTVLGEAQHLTNNPGDNLTLVAAVTGSAPFGYQWSFNGDNIPGATTNSYTRFNLQASDAGSYSICVTNVAGSVTSLIATLAINEPPVISAQPQSVSTNVGANIAFAVSVEGTAPLRYQWRFNGSDLPGANASDYTRAGVQPSDAGNYSVVASNIAGVVTSADAVLTVIRPHIESIRLLSGQGYQLDLSGGPGRFAVEFSPGLTSWSQMTTLTATGAVFQFTDPDLTQTGRFYRLLGLP